MDTQILATQKWLNATYGAVVGWVKVNENGLTGWDVIYGLRRGLQRELGISPVASGFGDATRAAFVSKIGRITPTSPTPPNVLRLLNGSLWCKGYQGLYEGDPVSFSPMAAYVGQARQDLGLGSANPFVDVKLMESLLSMDAYVIPFFSNGDGTVREVQQWLNRTYSGRRDFALIPCDGIFSRQVQTALLFALQFDFGMADGTANGNFGPGTQSGLKTQAPVGPGSVDSGTRHFVRLYQAAMRFNRYYDVPFSGSFDSTTATQTSKFQTFMEIPVTGRGDYTTWANLLVSSGDTTIKTKGFDTNRQLSAAQAAGARANGYTHVGRYTVGADKFITAAELDALRSAGLRLFPLHQRFNDSAATMTVAAGRTQALEAVERCRVLGLPANTLVFFSVDFDPVGETINGPVTDFFRGVGEVMGSMLNGAYKVGVYGTRNVCQVLLDAGRAEGAFVAGMSTGYSGNMGFPMPSQWHYNQIVEVSENLGGTSIGVDHDVVSSRASAVDLSTVVSPPVERDGSSTATGFDVVFEWICRAEVACERAISNADSLLNPLKAWKVAIPEHLLHWLRRPEYWGDANYAGLWGKYTPQVDSSQGAAGARAASESALTAFSPAKPPSTRDVAHFAATALGYRTWGVPTTWDNYGLGDLGGWPLDLLQAWGDYDRLPVKPDLATWMTGNLGASGTKFSRTDIVADADAWLVTKALRDTTGSTLSGVGRRLWRMTSAQRVKKFYADRFGSSAENIATSFAKLVDGIDVGPVTNFPFTVDKLRQAANANHLPTQAQAKVCGRVFGQTLARLSV